MKADEKGDNPSCCFEPSSVHHQHQRVMQMDPLLATDQPQICALKRPGKPGRKGRMPQFPVILTKRGAERRI